MGSLKGQRIVVTRAAHQAEELAAPLRSLGAEVILVPMIGIAAASDSEPLRRAARRVSEYDWILFTSANAVAPFAAELAGPPSRCRARIAAVGAATREALEKHGFQVSLTPAEYVAESLLEAFSVEDLNGRRVLIPSAAVTRDVVSGELRKRGAQVDVVEAYRNILPSTACELAASVFREPYPDWVLFASSSAVEHLVRLVGVEPLSRTKIASIGPITSASVRKHGLPVNAEARPHSVRGLVDSICAMTRDAVR